MVRAQSKGEPPTVAGAGAESGAVVGGVVMTVVVTVRCGRRGTFALVNAAAPPADNKVADNMVADSKVALRTIAVIRFAPTNRTADRTRIDCGRVR